MDVELLDKIRTFLADELARTEDRACIRIDLASNDAIERDPIPIRVWVGNQLQSGADWFAHTIVETAKTVAAAAESGRQHFIIRSHQPCGARPVLSFTIITRKEDQNQSVGDPYRTSHPPEVKINGRVADQLLRHLEKLTNDDKLDSETRRRALAECYHTLRVAIETSQGGTIASLMETVTKENTKLLEAATKETDKLYDSLEKMVKENDALKETLASQATRRERITQMTATIAAGIWARNDPALDLGDADSKAIVAKLARATAELILQQETVDVR
jgi:hypothetical protein